jgi:hypothetical protein
MVSRVTPVRQIAVRLIARIASVGFCAHNIAGPVSTCRLAVSG